MTRKFAGTELLIATHNQGKVKEYCDILGSHITFKIAGDIGLPDVEETGTTYLENAKIKALHGAQFSGLPTLGDDSGFEIDALGGRPGLYTARYIREKGSAEETFLTLQKEIGDKIRTVRFVCCLCLAWPDGHFEYVEEQVVGQFTYPARGTNGFGFDPVFMREGDTKTFGEISAAEKNANSHRSNAAQEMLRKCFS